MWPTDMIGSFCEECGAPFTIAWRETEGRRYRYRVDVEVLVSCGCEGFDRMQPEFIEPEEWI